MVEAKLLLPRISLDVVPRPVLWAALDHGVTGPITTVTAPPGSGKTVLLSSWLRRTSGPAIAWLSVDAQDRDPVRFWAHAVAAIARSGALPSSSPLHGITVSRTGLDQTFQARLLNALLELRRPTVLVLDDVHELEGPDADDEPGADPLLSRLLLRPPPMLRLVLAGRAQPQLPLHRARLAGDVTELGVDDLAFDLLETTALLRASGLELPQTEVTRLCTQTEGWAAGLRMHALALRRPGASRPGAPEQVSSEPDGDGRPGERQIADFLVHEVLDRLDPLLRDLLVRTSFLDRVCGPLADAVLGTTGSGGRLDELEHSGTFVSGLGDSAVWYRYHQLLLDVLRRRLRDDHAAELLLLQGRAARWLAREGHLLDAVRHAVDSQDWGLVATVVTTDAWGLALGPEDHLLDQLLSRVPTDADVPGPRFPLLLALRAVEARQTTRATQLLARVAAALDDHHEADRDRLRVLAGIVALIGARWVGRASALLEASEGLLVLLAQTPDDSARPMVRLMAESSQGTALLLLGELARAEGPLHRGSAPTGERGPDRPVQNSLSYLALLSALRGEDDEAETAVDQARHYASDRGWTALMQLTPALLAASVLRFEADDLTVSAAVLDEAELSYAADPEPAMLVLLRIQRARLTAANGHHRPALQLLNGLDATAERVSRWLTGQLVATRADLLLGRGDVVAALDALRQAPRLADHDAAAAVLGRVLLAGGDARAARRAVRRLTAGGAAQRRWHDDALLTEALATAQLGELGEMLAALRRLGTTTSGRDGHVPAPRVLQERVDELDRVLLPVFADDPALAPDLPDWLRLDGPGPAAVTAPALSGREAAVLQFLPTMLTAEQIADRMSVSPHTVRTQVRQIYRKLGVRRRSEAVRLATQRGLL